MSREEKDKVITHLHTVLRPFLLRRVKTDVEESLPKKKEYLVYAPLTPYQRTLYQAALTGSQALRAELQKRSNKGKEDVASETASVIEVDDGESDSGGSSADAEMRRSKRAAAQTLSATGRYNVDTASESAIGRSVAMAMEKKEAQKLAAIVAHKEMAAKVGRGSLNNLLMQLRKICNHPYLFQGTEDEDEKESLDDNGDEALASNVRKQIESSKNGKKKEKIPDIVAKSGKLLLLERLLPALFARGHKVRVESSFAERASCSLTSPSSFPVGAHFLSNGQHPLHSPRMVRGLQGLEVLAARRRSKPGRPQNRHRQLQQRPRNEPFLVEHSCRWSRDQLSCRGHRDSF